MTSTGLDKTLDTVSRATRARRNIIMELRRLGATVTTDSGVRVNGVLVYLDVDRVGRANLRATFGLPGEKRWRGVKPDGSINEITRFATDMIEYAAGLQAAKDRDAQGKSNRDRSQVLVDAIREKHGTDHVRYQVGPTSTAPDMVDLSFREGLPIAVAIELLQAIQDHDPEFRVRLDTRCVVSPDLADAAVAVYAQYTRALWAERKLNHGTVLTVSPPADGRYTATLLLNGQPHPQTVPWLDGGVSTAHGYSDIVKGLRTDFGVEVDHVVVLDDAGRRDSFEVDPD